MTIQNILYYISSERNELTIGGSVYNDTGNNKGIMPLVEEHFNENNVLVPRFSIEAINRGTDAIGNCCITVASPRGWSTGLVYSPDIILGSFYAYQQALERMKSDQFDFDWSGISSNPSFITQEKLPSEYKLSSLERYEINGGSGQIATAKITMKTRKGILTAFQEGNGPIDAAFRAICQITEFSLPLSNFEIATLGKNSSADGLASIKIQNINGYQLVGGAIDSNIVVAAINALINAINYYDYTERYYIGC
jgi:LeuA allosteric (dimerisation) domain